MKFSCEKCDAQYVLPDEKIGERGVQVRCKRCGHVNLVQRTATQRISEVLEEQPLAQLELSESSTERSSIEAMDSMFDAIFDPKDAAQSTPELSVDNEPTLDPSSVSAEPEPTRDWWVAIDNQQVGPLSRPELEARITNGTVNRASLVWKTGMANWAPLEDVPELGTLIGRAATERELEKVAGAETAVPQGVHLGHAEKLEVDPIEWKPSAATQLSELVQAEMKKDGPSGRGDVIAPAAETGADLPAFHAPSGGSGFAQEQRSFSWVPILLVLLAVSGFLYSQGLIQIGTNESSISKTAELAKAAAAIPVAEAKPPVVPTSVVPKKEDPKPEAVEAKPEDTATKKAEAVQAKKASPIKKVKRVKKSTKPKKKAKPTASPKKPVRKAAQSGDDIDDVFNNAPALPARLSMAQVKSATKKNSVSLRSCIGSAIDSREVTPGRHTLELSFNILPNGRIQKSKMAGPYYLQGTSLPKCLAAAMRDWRFPKSKQGNRVDKFPIPFNYKP
jgi:predicted Zn finger-like uncharacterized protein